MTHRFITLVVLLSTVMALAACAGADDDLKQISSDGITVSYPPKMETQAQRIMAMAKTQLLPSLQIHKQMVTLLSDPAAVAAEITGLLGVEEAQAKTTVRLMAYRQKSEALLACFSNIRLTEKAAAVATGGVDAGALQVRYQQDSDEFKMGVDLSKVTAETLKRSYFPVFVNADGTIRAEEKIPNMAMDFLGSTQLMLVAPVHESAAWIVTQQCNLYHPFTRWFNEGVSGWVTRKVIAKLDPKLSTLVDQVLMPGPSAKKYREKLNLLAWPQTAFQNSGSRDIDPAIEVAQTQYSVEAISNLLGSNRTKALAVVMGDLKYRGSADTDAICESIKKATGTDFKKTLAAYVPKDMSDPAEAKRLISQADKLAQSKKWSDATAKLRRALQITPADVNARLNLAWVERETGERLDSEIQVFTAARLLDPKTKSFHMFVPSMEGNYVLARLAILLGNLESAKEFLNPILAVKPDHQDAKRAMQEIRALESAAKSGARQ